MQCIWHAILVAYGCKHTIHYNKNARGNEEPLNKKFLNVSGVHAASCNKDPLECTN